MTSRRTLDLALRAGRVLLGAVAFAVPAAAVGTYVGMRQLTDAPRVRIPRREVRARFHDPVDFGAPAEVHLSGERAGLPGRWGLRFPGGYAQVHEPIRTDHDPDLDVPVVVRHYTVLEGEAPTPTHQHERRLGDRRALARREAARREAARRGHPAGSARPAPTAVEERRGEDRRSGDRRRSDRRLRDRRRVQLPRPWPITANVSSYAWPDDPQVLARATGSRFEIDAVPSPDRGHLPAWRLTPQHGTRSARDTWVIGVHGRGARRAELFRILHAAITRGNTALAISYRSDEWTRTPTRTVTLGHDEWQDLEAAVDLAIEAGARRIVLAGCSLGGAIVATFLRRSERADRVVGVILDSPALDWGPILEHIASVAHLPKVFVAPIMGAARVRSHLDFDALNHVKGAAEFGDPILLFHGDADPVVPVWLSDAFAAARPDLVTYVRVDGAGHVHSWNHAPERYERALHAFFDQVNVRQVPGRTRRGLTARVARILPDAPSRPPRP